ncbi:MAG: site-2 protease family protein [Candidatus Omnitrophica bacterium]|nr:site-2 protease family protein [Candidatus Omnitrophota bacterium]
MAITYLLIVFFILLFSITMHEFAHGWIAYKLGDPTPKDRGRLTLNPFAHIDLIGTIVVPFLIVFISRGLLPPIGRAKPIPINPSHFKNPKQDMMLVGAAGPLTNIAIAIVFILLAKVSSPLISEILAFGAVLNLVLAIFNLIPIPPLDGSRIVAGLLPSRQYQAYRKIERFGFFILIPFIFLIIATGLFGKIINFLQKIVYSL